jgi:Kef-type K+ transport system membrane component KefB
MLVNNDISETDLFRYDMIINIEDHIQWNIFPKGFVTKRSIDNNIYIDFPIYELFYMIGMPLCFIIFLVFAYRIIYHLKNFIFNKVRESEFCIVLSILLIILLFTEGTFLNYPFTTPFTGYALARIFSNNNLIS